MAPPVGGARATETATGIRSRQTLTEEDLKRQFMLGRTRGLQKAQWEEDAYEEKLRGASSYNVVNYDSGDLATTSNTYTMSTALSSH